MAATRFLIKWGLGFLKDFILPRIGVVNKRLGLAVLRDGNLTTLRASGAMVDSTWWHHAKRSAQFGEH